MSRDLPGGWAGKSIPSGGNNIDQDLKLGGEAGGPAHGPSRKKRQQSQVEIQQVAAERMYRARAPSPCMPGQSNSGTNSSPGPTICLAWHPEE